MCAVLKPIAYGVSILMALMLVSLLADQVAARKSKATAQPFRDAIPFIRCQVCETMVHEGAEATRKLRSNASARGVQLREEEILEDVIDLLCNPFSSPGQWIRRADLRVSDDELNIGLIFHEEPGKCRRDCFTVAEACTSLVDSDEADMLPSLLFKGKRSVPKMQNAVCKGMCKGRGKRIRAGERRRLRREWGSEEHEPIDAKELEVEEMMDRMQRNRQPGEPGMDFFSRDEMMQMQGAVRDGDLDRLTELDPSASDLTEEELGMLSEMYRGEQHGAEGVASNPPNPPQVQAQEDPPAWGTEDDSDTQSTFSRLWASFFG